MVKVYQLTHSGFRPTVKTRGVIENGREYRKFMRFDASGLEPPDGLVFQARIIGEPHAFSTLGFGFSDELWSAIKPILGDRLDTWRIRFEDHDRVIRGVAARAKALLSDALDEDKSDVRYIKLGDRLISKGAYGPLVFKPGSVAADAVFQASQIASKLLVAEDVAAELRITLKKRGFERKLLLHDTAEPAETGVY